MDECTSDAIQESLINCLNDSGVGKDPDVQTCMQVFAPALELYASNFIKDYDSMLREYLENLKELSPETGPDHDKYQQEITCVESMISALSVGETETGFSKTQTPARQKS